MIHTALGVLMEDLKCDIYLGWLESLCALELDNNIRFHIVLSIYTFLLSKLRTVSQVCNEIIC